MKLLSKAEILRAFSALAGELEENQTPVEILIVGGAALVLLFEARFSTKDVDGLVVRGASSKTLREASRQVASKLDLPEDWLNDGAKGYLHGLSDGGVVFSEGNLTIRSASVQQLLAMKLAAWRDDVDIDDARLLLCRVSGGRDEVWSAVATFVPPGCELKARYAFDDLWEAESGTG